HRLDAQTSGVLLFSKTKRMNQPLQDLFKNHQILKTYVAITHVGGNQFLASDTFQIKNFLAQNSDKPARAVAVKSGGKPATTDFKILHRAQKYWIIEAKPVTGRTHQIRTHLAEAGIPLIADQLYGGHAQSGIGRFLLHARRLQLTHPLENTLLVIEAPFPHAFHGLVGPDLAFLR
ncbi:MAG: RluA family pseudouridine synthase, partial [Bdellovibrionales bacterium]|nr:RluA family pseudouridine synthase [Bdellovibrionales bacterium]